VFTKRTAHAAAHPDAAANAAPVATATPAHLILFVMP
jgi:hypothetical protein